MALESGTYINSLVTSNPTATDALAQADDHLRLIKATIKNTFPNVAGVINANHSELDILDGDTSATSVTMVDGDQVIINDNGTMIQATLSDLLSYINAGMTLRADVVTASSLADAIVGTANIADGAVTAAKIATGAIEGDKFADGVALSAGMVMPYAGSTSPTGWLLCYGQAVSRVTYSTLYGIIGTTYGSGDGSSTFNVPDLRGRVVAGQDDMGGTSANRMTSSGGGINGDTLGATGGSDTHTLTGAQTGVPSHTHTLTVDEVQSKSSISSGYNTSAKTGFDRPTLGNAQSGSQDAVYSRLVDHSETTDSISEADASEAHPIIQPTAILNYIIKI